MLAATTQRRAGNCRFIIFRCRRWAQLRAAPFPCAVHGIYSNAMTFDIDPEHSLARHLAAQGYAVYALSLRGIGPGGTRHRRFGRFRHAAIFSDYLQRDLDAALSQVSAHSGFAKVHYLGHSMGGMLFYPFGAIAKERLGRAVTIGSMGRLGRWKGWRRALASPFTLLRAIGFFSLLPHLFAREASRYLLAPLVGIEPFVARYFVAPANRERAADRHYFFAACGNTPTLLLLDFARMLKVGVFGDGQVSYENLCQENRVPTLVVAGSADRVAPERYVRFAYEQLGGEKEYLLKANYGHVDLLYSRAAQREVWPRIVEWFGRV